MNRAKVGMIILGFVLAVGCAGMSGEIRKEHKARLSIAVLPFENRTNDKGLDWLSYGLSETATTELAKGRNYRLIERVQIEKVFEEWGFQVSDAVDPKTAVKMGEILGVQFVVIGSFQKIGGKFKFDMRRVKVESGEVFESESVIGPEDEIFDLQVMVAKKLNRQFEIGR